jgi:hypothetical protein
MAKPRKKFAEYLVESATEHKTAMDSYVECPARTFLSYVCDAHDAFVHCEHKFTKKLDGTYNKDSEESLRHISCALLGTIMGHFETFQKTVFAGLVERTGLLPKFDIDEFFRSLKRTTERELVISPARLMAFRKLNAPVGLVLADSLNGWHDPARVVTYMKAILPTSDCFDSRALGDLRVLWQLRHSIVHTGAWLTFPDAQKVQSLASWGGKPIIFEHTFVNAVARRLHFIVKGCNESLRDAASHALGRSPPEGVAANFSEFLEVSSPKAVWLS